MNEQVFNKELKAIAPDIRLLYDPERKRWAVYQLRQDIGQSFLLPESTRRRYNAEQKPWLLFVVDTADKGFRLPDNRDLKRVISSVHSGRQFWEKGSDWYVDRIEEQEADRRAAKDARLDDTFRAVAREVAHAGKVVKPRGRNR